MPSLYERLTNTYYPLYLLLWFAWRAYHLKLSPYALKTGVKNTGCFQDFVYEFKLNSVKNSMFLHAIQAGYRKKITANDLFAAEGDFSLKQHFDAYCNIKDKGFIRCSLKTNFCSVYK